jgi:hypothetical protein
MDRLKYKLWPLAAGPENAPDDVLKVASDDALKDASDDAPDDAPKETTVWISPVKDKFLTRPAVLPIIGGVLIIMSLVFVLIAAKAGVRAGTPRACEIGPLLIKGDVPALAAKDFSQLELDAFVTCYSLELNLPLWTVNIVSRARGTRANRFSNKYGARVKSESYTHSGFDRGHMTPAGDIPRQAITFDMINVAPMHPSYNRGEWAALEAKIRSLYQGHVVVTSTIRGDKFFVTAEGAKINIPSRFCKTVLDAANAGPIFERCVDHVNTTAGA